jgi:hypothetical protein
MPILNHNNELRTLSLRRFPKNRENIIILLYIPPQLVQGNNGYFIADNLEGYIDNEANDIFDL